jgi:hypothetical protein
MEQSYALKERGMIRFALASSMIFLLAADLPGCGGEGTPACPSGRIECWQECVDPQLDRAHCGACGQACDEGAYCEAGSCVDCRHACQAGEMRCADADSFQACVADADTCLGWAPPTACGDGYTCKYGACEPDCADECPGDGQTRCDPVGGGLQTCGDPDADGCLEWDSPIDCGRCAECLVDACQSTCTDECPGLGERQCAGPESFQECGDHDADEGWEWGPATDCPAGQVCDAGMCR